MEFRFDEDQLALQDAMRTFCKGHFDLASVAAREGRPDEPATWSALADMGVFGMLLPAERGGPGSGAIEAAIVFEQLGAHLARGPLLWSTITAPLLTDVHPGALRVAGIDAGEPADGLFVVEHAAESDVVVIVHDDRVERCSAMDLPTSIPGEPFDPLTPTAIYERLPSGALIGGREEARTLRRIGTVLASAMLVGVAQGSLDVASNYALERRQFGVPIGSFQAIKHLLADMYVRVELARSAMYAAAAIIDEDRASAASKASGAAKLLAGDAAIGNGRTAVQVLGGMGFTWEMLPHYFLKRAWMLEHSFGTSDSHALALGDALGDAVGETESAWT